MKVAGPMRAPHLFQFRRSLLLACGAVLLAVAPGVHAAADELITRGNQLMAAGDYQTALETYQARLQADGKNVEALLGAGNAYSALGQLPKAVQMLERAYQASPKERAVASDLAILLFKTDSQPRAMKLVRDYLAANPKSPDEPMLDQLLFMLDSASEATKKLKMHAECKAFSEQYIKTLEAQRPGFRRWGSDWVEAKVVTDYLSGNKALDREIEKVTVLIRNAESEITRLDKQTAGLEFRVARGFDSRATLRDHLDEIQRLKDERQKKIEERQGVIHQLAKPMTPPEPVWMALGTPAPPLSKTEVATNTPPASSNNGNAPPANNPPASDRPANDRPPIAPPPQPPANAQANEPAKRVTRYAVAFAISQDTLVTGSDVAADATELLVQSVQGTTDDVTVIRTDAATGLTLLRLKKLKAATLPLAAQFAGGPVECVALPNVELFKADATVIGGKAAAPKEPWTVALDKNPRLPGAPLIVGNKVVGVTLAERDSEPGAVRAVTLERLSKFIGEDFGTRGPATVDPKQSIFQLVATHRSK